MKADLTVGTVSLIAWIVLVFVVQWPSGWAHVPLGIAFVTAARLVVLSGSDAPKKLD
ncbi:MAG: hypothetical protein ACE5FJ_03490 [Gemmatimonadales bacterium]